MAEIVTSTSTGKSSVDAFLKSLQKKYNSEYKIDGQDDPLFKSVASALSDKVKVTSLKRKRLSEVRALKALESTVVNEFERKISSAPREIDFLQTAALALKKISRTGSASAISSAAVRLTRELSALVKSYEAARGVDGIRPDTNTEDAEFIKAAEALGKTLAKTLVAIKGRLKLEKKFFNSGIAHAERTLKSLNIKFEALPAASSSVNIIV